MHNHRHTRQREFIFPVVREIVRRDPSEEPPPERRQAAEQQRLLVAASLIRNPIGPR